MACCSSPKPGEWRVSVSATAPRVIEPRAIVTRSVIVHRTELKRLLAPGEFRTNRPRIKYPQRIFEFDAELPKPSSFGTQSVALVEFGRNLEPEDVCQSLQAKQLQLPTFRHHLAFALAYPDCPQMIVALMQDEGGKRRIAIFNGGEITLVDAKIRFGKNTRFLAREA
jgi:hypothetical protein